MVFCLVGSALAASAQPTQSPQATTPQNTESGAGKAERTFAGLKFGVGLSFTSDTGTHDRVEEATVDANGFVRVTKTSNGLARIMLEAHYFFPPKSGKASAGGEGNWGWGPFVAVQPGSNEIINALGMGILVGWRHDKESNQSFNLGLGYSVDPSTKVLGDEFVEDQLAPKGPDGKPLAVRFKTREQKGWLLLASFGWH